MQQKSPPIAESRCRKLCCKHGNSRNCGKLVEHVRAYGENREKPVETRSGPAIPTHWEPKNFKRTGVCKQVGAWGPPVGRGGARSVRWSAGSGRGAWAPAGQPTHQRGGRGRARRQAEARGQGSVEAARSVEGPCAALARCPGEAARGRRRGADAPRALSPLRTVSRARRAQGNASPPRRETTPTQQGRGR